MITRVEIKPGDELNVWSKAGGGEESKFLCSVAVDKAGKVVVVQPPDTNIAVRRYEG